MSHREIRELVCALEPRPDVATSVRKLPERPVDTIRADGIEISALALPQCCISAAVAAVLHDAGATNVVVAARPDENALLEALGRTLRPRSGIILSSDHDVRQCSVFRIVL